MSKREACCGQECRAAPTARLTASGLKPKAALMTPANLQTMLSAPIWLLLLFFLLPALPAGSQPPLRPIGVARVDVTPAEPIRLTGFGSRKTNSIVIEQKLWAKALALGTDAESPAVLITLDNCGIAEATYQELARRLGKK